MRDLTCCSMSCAFGGIELAHSPRNSGHCVYIVVFKHVLLMHKNQEADADRERSVDGIWDVILHTGSSSGH